MQTYSTFTSLVRIFTYSAGTKSNYNHMQDKTYKNKFRVAADREKLISMISSPPLNTTGRSINRSLSLILRYSESLPNKYCSLYQQIQNGMLHVIANEEVMELLCGGVPWKDIESFLYHDYGAFHEDTSSSQLLMHVTNILVA